MAKTFTYNRGDTQVYGMKMFQRDKKTAFDITGGKLTMTINSSNDPTDNTTALFTRNKTSFTATDDNPTGGIGTIKVDNADGQNWPPGNYFYDMQFIDATNEFTSSKQGKFLITADISRNTS